MKIIESYREFVLESKSSRREMIILVGLPGSGKSSYINSLKGATVCSADKYFEKSGEYVFNPDDLLRAHRECLEDCQRAVSQGKKLVVIDNTNLTDKEREPYEKLAEEYGYNIKYVVWPATKQDLSELAKRNRHSVSLETLEKMSRRFKMPSSKHGIVIIK